MFKPKTTTVQQVVTRLTPEVFAHFAAQFPTQIVSRETTEIQASYYLGINHVLNELRKGIVVEVAHTR